MADSSASESSNLRTPKRFITEYNASGLGVFHTTVPETLPSESAGSLKLHLAYATTSSPADFEHGSDISTYSSFLSKPPGIFLPGGSVLRIIDMQPSTETPLHRTVSLDYGVVLEGEIELVLDSGESRIMKKNDVSIQRGTNHLWRNRSQVEWTRMLFVTLDAKPVTVNGERLDFSSGM